MQYTINFIMCCQPRPKLVNYLTHARTHTHKHTHTIIMGYKILNNKTRIGMFANRNICEDTNSSYFDIIEIYLTNMLNWEFRLLLPP